MNRATPILLALITLLSFHTRAANATNSCDATWATWGWLLPTGEAPTEIHWYLNVYRLSGKTTPARSVVSRWWQGVGHGQEEANPTQLQR